MILSDRDIRRAVADGRIRILPEFDEADLRPTGVRLHLAAEVLIPPSVADVIDVTGTDAPPFERQAISPEGLVLRRGDFVLASSTEHISTAPDLVALIDGRSTLARLGLMVHCASTTFDHLQEFRSVTFELANVGPFNLRLHTGTAVGLLSFVQLSGPVEQPPHAQYRNQTGPTAPVLGTTHRKPHAR